MSAPKNNSHHEQSIGKTVYDFFTSILTSKSTPSPTARRQRERNQTKKQGNKHRHHHHHHRRGPHDFDREEKQGLENPLNCEISTDAGFWKKAHNLQAEAVLRRPPQATVRSSHRLLADLNGGMDALAPRKTPTTSGSHRRERHHHSSTQNQDPISEPPQATARRGKDGVVEKRTKNEVTKPPPAAHNPAPGFGSHRRRGHYDQDCPEVVPKIPPVVKIKARTSPKTDRRNSVQNIHHSLRNRQVTGPSQPRAIPVESTRDKASVNLGNIPAREDPSQISTTATSTLVESTLYNLSSSALKESYLQEIPPRQNVVRHQGVQIMHPQRREGSPHSQEATIINPRIGNRDSVQTRLSDFLPKPLKITSTRTVGKSEPEPSTSAVMPSPRPKGTWLLGVVDDDANRESRSSSSRTPPLNQTIYTSPQSNRSSPIRQNRGSAEDSSPIQASSNESWLSSGDSIQQGYQQLCRICRKPCVQDRKIREVEHLLCATCEARAFIQPYPTVGSPASFDRPRRPSGGSTPGGRIRGRDIPTSPTLHEGEEFFIPPPVPLKTGSQRPRLKDVGSSNFPRGRQVMPLTPPSSSGSSHSGFKDVGSSPLHHTLRVVPPTSPSPSPPMSQIPRQGDNPNFPRGGRVRPPIPLTLSERSIPNFMLSSTNSPTPKNNTTKTLSSAAQKTNRLQPHDKNHLASSSRLNPSSRPSMADSYITCTDNDYEIPKVIPFILYDDEPAGLGISLGDGDEQKQQHQAAARSPRTPSSPMENRERNLVGRYQNKWALPYSPSVMANEDQNEGVDRPTWYYDHWDKLLGDHQHLEGDPGGGDDGRRRNN